MGDVTPAEDNLRPTLVGRSDELVQIADIAELAVEHGAQVILLSGDAGIGKSTLVNEACRRLRAAGWGAHVGYCIEFADRPLPFGPIVAILRSLFLDNLDHIDSLAGRRRDDLAGLLPELGDSDGASLTGDVDRLFDAIAGTLTEASRRRPLAVVVEDIHWADAATRDALAALTRSLGEARVLLLITERAGAVERSHPLRIWLAEHRRLLNVQSVELKGLSHAELGEQAAGVLGQTPERQLIDELAERTGGNPYFSQELLIARREGGNALPATLADFLTSRISRFTDDEREVLRAVAVAGGMVDHRMLSAMLDGLDVGTLVRGLYDASILHLDGNDYTLGHALVKEAILRDVLPFEAEELHRRAAEAIVSDPRRGSSVGDLTSLAVHWVRANDPDRSLAAAVEAAYAAASLAAYGTAADMVLEALDAWPMASSPEQLAGRSRDQLLLHAADWLTSCHRGAEAIELLSDALDGWAASLPDGRRALLFARMGPIHWHIGNPPATARVLAEAKRLVGNEVSAEAAQVHHQLSKQAVADGQIHPALASADRAISIAEKTGPSTVLVEALTTRALALGVTGAVEEGLALARESRELALLEGSVSLVAQTYRTEMLIIVFQDGRTEACLEASRQGLAYAEQHCGPRWRAEFHLDLCLGYVEGGRLNEAGPLFDVLFASELDDLRRLTVLQTAGLHALATDRLDGAEGYLSEATDIALRYKSAQETGFQSRLLAELARRQGHLEDALPLINEALELQLAGDNLTYTRESIVEKIRIARSYKERGIAGADQLVADTRLLAESFTDDGKANVAMRALMDLELAACVRDVDRGRAAQSVELLESTGFLLEAAHARLLLVDQCVGDPKVDRSVLISDFAALHETATTHGMTWVANRTAALAKVAGVSLGTSSSEEPGSSTLLSELPHHLTAREVEVMSLLAEGLTNKAIGERLYVSPRTVSTHISNLLPKVGVTNRGEAAAAYHRLGLAEMIDLREQEVQRTESVASPHPRF